jgi:hypothetical protein
MWLWSAKPASTEACASDEPALRDPMSSRIVNLTLAALLVITTAVALAGQVRG